MAHAAAEVLQLEGRVLLSTTTLTPTADAYTRDGTYANTNYGSATDLAVKYASISGQGYNRNAFFTFNLSGVSSVGEAVLRVYGAVSDSSTLTIGALPVSTTTWGQNTITWNNQPSAGTSISATVITGTTARWLQFDVTSYLQAQKAAGATSVSIELAGLTSTTGDGDFNSTNDGSNQPQLVVNSSDASLTPTNDAYVLDSSPNTNYGTSTTLVTKKASTNNRNIFVTFDTSSYTGTDSGAFLQFYGNNSSGTETYIPVNVYSVATTTWAQGTITWNNQPTAGSTVQATSVVIDGTSRLYTFDVSSYVAAQRALGNSTVSFMIQSGATTTSSAPTFNSTNATANKPQLVLSGGPTVATAATASTADGININLNVLGSDPNGESTLTYTWTTTSLPTGAAVSFSDNADNTAKSSTAAINKVGTYSFQVTISDGSSNITSSVNLTVSQMLTSIVATPGGAALENGTSQQLTAVANDQFANAMSTQPTFSWTAGSGSVTSGGLYTAQSSGTGSDTVTVSGGGTSCGATIEYGTYVGTVYDDANADQMRESSEEGLWGQTVYLDVNGNGTKDAGEPSTTTDGAGDFALSTMSGSSQTIRLLQDSAWTPTTATSVGVSGLPIDAMFGLQAATTKVLNSTGTGGKTLVIDNSTHYLGDVIVGGENPPGSPVSIATVPITAVNLAGPATTSPLTFGAPATYGTGKLTITISATATTTKGTYYVGISAPGWRGTVETVVIK